jgi:hypothetical protein
VGSDVPAGPEPQEDCGTDRRSAATADCHSTVAGRLQPGWWSGMKMQLAGDLSQ